MMHCCHQVPETGLTFAPAYQVCGNVDILPADIPRVPPDETVAPVISSFSLHPVKVNQCL